MQIFYEFPKWHDHLATIPASDKDKSAPLPQCVLLHRAFSHSVINYHSQLVPLKSIRQLLESIQPLTERESDNLRGYMRSLLPHPLATHMPIDRFYAFASAVESIAQRRGQEVGDHTRRIIYRLIQLTTKIGETTVVP